jgi:hypothetical protein
LINSCQTELTTNVDIGDSTTPRLTAQKKINFNLHKIPKQHRTENEFPFTSRQVSCLKVSASYSRSLFSLRRRSPQKLSFCHLICHLFVREEKEEKEKEWKKP